MSNYAQLERSLESRAQFDALREDDLPTTFSETTRAAFALTRREELSSSASTAWARQNEERANKIRDLGGDWNAASTYQQIPLGVTQEWRRYQAQGDVTQAPSWRAFPQWHTAYEHVRQFESQYPDQVLSDAALFEVRKKEASELRAQEQETMRRGSGLASFVGTAGAVMTDPLVLASLPFGVGEIQAGRTLLQVAGRVGAAEGAIAMAVEIPIQAEVYRYKRELDAPWSLRDSALNVLAAGIGTAALSGTLSAGLEGTRRALARYREAKVSPDVKAELDSVAEILEDIVHVEDNNPLRFDDQPMERPHHNALDVARAQDENGQPIDVRDQVEPWEPQDGIDQVLRQSEASDNLVPLDPRGLEIDAELFQFKAGADTAGVTSALKGVQRFDRRLAGVSLIWERADGKRFIADGHQRRDLGIRAIAAGQDPAEVQLNGFILRETDGVSALDARRMAAVKNMAEGTGTAVDAAKILREVGPLSDAMLPPLPPGSALVRQARGLARLSDDNFMQVVNGVVDARFAALVGHAAEDPRLQQAMLEVLRKTSPAKEVQARSIVDQVRTQGIETRVTEDLFGESAISESLYLERAQVLDAALKESRNDRATFGRLVSEETRILDAGDNQLDRAANMQRIQEASHAQAKISALANSKGPISDALTEAARAIKNGEKPATAAAAFLEAARREILESNSGGRPAGGARSGRETPGGEQELGAFDFTPGRGLTPEDQAIEARFLEKLSTTPWPELKAEYAALPDTHGGRVLSTDAARELSPDYLKDRTLSSAVHEPSSAFIKRLYAERLAEEPKAGQVAEVVFTAGGTGAGKTTGLKFLKTADDSQIIFDGNLANEGSAIKKIDQAIAAGKRVVVNYVYRDPIEAWVNGVMTRAMRQFEEHGTGRTVPIDVHASTHAGARSTLDALVARYADNELVDVMVVDNSNGKGKTAVSTVDKLPEVVENAIVDEGNKAIDEALANGKINEKVAEGLRAEQIAPGAANRAGSGGLDQQSRSAGDTAKTGGLKPASAIDAAPRAIVRATADEHIGTPLATRTGTVEDLEYETVLAQADDLIDKYGEQAHVVNEVNGEAVQRSLRTTLDELDRLEESLEGVRVCTTGSRAAA